MALIKCPECGNDMSDQASSCANCGWRPPKSKWWLWIPLGIIGLFLVIAIIGSFEPEYKKQARELRRICEKISSNQFECDQIYHTTIADGELLAIQKADEAKMAKKK